MRHHADTRAWSASAVRYRHQPADLVAALHGPLLHHADPAHVELVVDHAGLERRPLPREQRAVAEAAVRDGHRRVPAEDLEVVLGVAAEVLLRCAEADARVHGHDDAAPRAVAAGLPRALGARRVAVAVELARVLAEVPDGAGAVLGEPVARVLDHAPVLEDAVADDAGVHALDQLGAVGDAHDVARGRAVLLALEAVDGAGL